VRQHVAHHDDVDAAGFNPRGLRVSLLQRDVRQLRLPDQLARRLKRRRIRIDADDASVRADLRGEDGGHRARAAADVGHLRAVTDAGHGPEVDFRRAGSLRHHQIAADLAVAHSQCVLGHPSLL
jgi:hypothetical protein